MLFEKDIYDKIIDGSYENDREIILYPGKDLIDLATEIIKKTHYQITNIKFGKDGITSIQHPVTEQIIEACPEYHSVNQICDTLLKLYPGFDAFNFRNQSLTTLITSLFEVMYGQIRKSQYVENDIKIYDTFRTKALIQTLTKNKRETEDCQGYDICKSYYNAVLNMDTNYNIFSCCDTFVTYEGEDIVNGEYVIDNIIIDKLGGVFIPRMVVTSHFLKYLLDNDYINKDKILLVKKASYTLDKGIFREFFLKIRDLFPDDNVFKKLYCNFIGELGKKYIKSDYGFITDSVDVVSASYYDSIQLNREFSTQNIKKLYFVRHTEKKRINNGHYSLWVQIICEGSIQLLELIKYVYNPLSSTLIGYNTDAVFVKKPRIQESSSSVEFHRAPIYINNGKYKLEKWKPKQYKPIEFIEDEVKGSDKIIKWKRFEMKDSEDEFINKIKDKSFVCSGIGGCGKSTLLKKINDLFISSGTGCSSTTLLRKINKQFNANGKKLVLCITNKARNNLRNKGLDNVYTFESYFKDKENIPLDSIDLLQIDEFSMVQTNYLFILYKLKLRKPELII